MNKPKYKTKMNQESWKDKTQKLKDICRARQWIAISASRGASGAGERLTQGRAKSRTGRRLRRWEHWAGEAQNGVRHQQPRYIPVSFRIISKIKNAMNMNKAREKTTTQTHLLQNSNWDFHRLFSCNNIKG